MSAGVPEIIQPLLWLEGKWLTSPESLGTGEYPTINNFSYSEELSIKFSGQPMLDYSSVTSHPVSGKPMHRESGFIRINGNQDVSLVLAHNFGLTSMEEGKLDGKENILCLASSNLGTGPRSKATGRVGGVILAAYGNMLQYNYLSIMSILSHLLLSVVIYCFLYCH